MTQGDWMDKKKHETHLYAFCTRLTADTKTHIGWKWRTGRRNSMQMEAGNNAGGARCLWDKVDFKTKTVTRDKEEHYIMIKGLIQ